MINTLKLSMSCPLIGNPKKCILIQFLHFRNLVAKNHGAPVGNSSSASTMVVGGSTTAMAGTSAGLNCSCGKNARNFGVGSVSSLIEGKTWENYKFTQSDFRENYRSLQISGKTKRETMDSNVLTCENRDEPRSAPQLAGRHLLCLQFGPARHPIQGGVQAFSDLPGGEQNE